MTFTTTRIAAAAAMALASTAALAAPVSTGGVFDMFQGLGYDQATAALSAPGTGTWGSDATITGFVDYAAGTWGVASTTPFYGQAWTASNGFLIESPGNYALDTATGHVSLAAPDAAGTLDGQMLFTVGAGQLAGAIDFAWSAYSGMRVVEVWNINPDGSLTAVYAPGMENGPFENFNAAFHITGANPLCLECPEASTYSMMLAGLGLVSGVARRRKIPT